MKLSQGLAKLTWVKSAAFRVLATTGLAAAALAVSTPAAQAQHVSFGVQIGNPGYYVAPAPVYGYAPGYYDRYRADDWRRHEAREAWERRERFEDRQRDFRSNGYRDNRYSNNYYGHR